MFTVNLVKLATVLSEKASTIVIIRDHYKVRMNTAAILPVASFTKLTVSTSTVTLYVV